MPKDKGFSVEGYDEILANIEKLGGNVQRESRKAIKESTILVRDELEKNTPKQAVPHSAHAKDHVVVSGIRKDKETEQEYMSVGFPGRNPDIKWRIHFVEFGTIRQRPQLFMTRTINDTSKEVQEIIRRTLKKGLKL